MHTSPCLERVWWASAPLAESRLVGAPLAESQSALLVEAKFVGALLAESRLVGAPFAESRLVEASPCLKKVRLVGVPMVEAQFDGAPLAESRLMGAPLAENVRDVRDGSVLQPSKNEKNTTVLLFMLCIFLAPSELYKCKCWLVGWSVGLHFVISQLMKLNIEQIEVNKY